MKHRLAQFSKAVDKNLDRSKFLKAIVLSIVITGMTAVGLHLYAQESKPRVVTISAKRFEFTPNQITLKRGEPVTLRVSAEDRDHGF